MRIEKKEKSIVSILSLLLVLTVAQPSYAAYSAFSDVPATHWSYDALNKLAKDGILEGYNDGSFHGEKTLSRYEMAIVVARVMTKLDKADAEDKAIIEKLETEFKAELEKLDEHMTSLDKKVDALTVHGQGRIRFDKAYTDTGTTTPNSHTNIDMLWGYQVNDRWQFKGESEYGRQMNYGGENETLQNSVAEQLYATGPLGAATVKGGRFSAYSPYGLVYDDKVTGGEVSFGKVEKITLQGGKATSTDDDSLPAHPGYASQNYSAILFAAPVNGNSNIQAGFLRIGGNVLMGQTPTDYVNYSTFAYDTKFTPDWSFKTAYAKSNAKGTTSTSPAWLAKIVYKGADAKVANTYDIYAMYRKSPQLAQYSNTDDWVQNVKGTRVGFDYVLDTNVTLLSWYTFGKDVDSNAKRNMFRTEVDFNF